MLTDSFSSPCSPDLIPRGFPLTLQQNNSLSLSSLCLLCIPQLLAPDIFSLPLWLYSIHLLQQGAPAQTPAIPTRLIGTLPMELLHSLCSPNPILRIGPSARAKYHLGSPSPSIQHEQAFLWTYLPSRPIKQATNAQPNSQKSKEKIETKKQNIQTHKSAPKPILTPNADV